MSEGLLEFTDAEFDNLITSSGKPVMVDFWAPWCGPCKEKKRMIEAVKEEFSEQLTVGKMDIQAHPLSAGKLQIRSIPTLLFFKDGNVVDSLVGAANEDKIRGKIEQLLG